MPPLVLRHPDIYLLYVRALLKTASLSCKCSRLLCLLKLSRFDAGKKDAVSMHRLSINEHCPLGAVYIPELSKLIVGVENSRTAEHQLAIYSIKIETKTVEHEKRYFFAFLFSYPPTHLN